jgi:predicted ATPase
MAGSMARRRAGALPVEISSLVGRRRELTEIKRLVATSRLVTLTGVGGVGKTRLAWRAAAELRTGFADGVCLVELSAVRDETLVAYAVASALELQDQTTRSLPEVLADYLADRRLLLILDTCEAVPKAAADIAAALLAAAPELRILATSRRSLGVLGEHTYVVAPLPVRDAATSGSGDGDAVALFVERAAAVQPGFALTADNAAAVTAICQRLDGIPLAIELAAARVRVLSVEQILSRLDDRFALLTTGNRTAVPRHQTLRVAIGWSHELCTPSERLLWARLSVFPADFDVDAAEEICSDTQLPAGLVFDLLTRLVDQSVLLPQTGPFGARYRMLDTIREYGHTWLAAIGQDGPLRRRHRDHYLALAERARP